MSSIIGGQFNDIPKDDVAVLVHSDSHRSRISLQKAEDKEIILKNFENKKQCLFLRENPPRNASLRESKAQFFL